MIFALQSRVPKTTIQHISDNIYDVLHSRMPICKSPTSTTTCTFTQTFPLTTLAVLLTVRFCVLQTVLTKSKDYFFSELTDCAL